MKNLENCVADSSVTQAAGRSSTAAHTPLPWAQQKYFPHNIVSAADADKHAGGSVHEIEDREYFATNIATADSNPYSNFAHEISKEQAAINAEFIVRACNSHYELVDALKAMCVNMANDGGEYRDCYKRALSVIAKAEGKQ